MDKRQKDLASLLRFSFYKLKEPKYIKSFQITWLLDDQITFTNHSVQIIWLGMEVNDVQQIQRHGKCC